jgi:hypothetical protein
MIRKFALALGTTALIGAAALAPTAASAHHYHHHFHGFGYGYGLGPVVVVNSPDCYFTKQKVWNGAYWTWQTVKVCE